MQLQEKTNLSNLERFRSAVERFCELAQTEGIPVRAYDGNSPSHFAALSEEAQAKVLHHFEPYVETCEQSILHRESLLFGKQFLWRVFQKLGLHPSSALLDRIEDGDIVEIYTASYVQVFRSLSFFPICSYTLDDLLCRPFWELFHREPELLARMMTTTEKVVEGKVDNILNWDIEDHWVNEIQSPAPFQAKVRYKCLSPLRNDAGETIAFVNIFRVLSCTRRDLQDAEGYPVEV